MNTDMKCYGLGFTVSASDDSGSVKLYYKTPSSRSYVLAERRPIRRRLKAKTGSIISTPFKADMGDFLYKYFKKYNPDNLYVSSVVRVDKTEKDGFSYTVSHKSITLNNLSGDDTADLFNTLNSG